jgi:glycosyltransferase involved in cell wall biosynthesis
MRVLFLQQQPCIRTLKYGVGLRSLGTAIELGFACQGRTLTESYGEGDDLFDQWWRIDGEAADVARVVREFRPDVIHCHNLPDRLTVVALEVAGGGVPVVHDVHDLQSLRHTPYEDGFAEPADPLLLEKQAVTGSDAVVTVSEEMADEIVARHGRPPRMLSFPNYAVGAHLPPALPAPDRPLGAPPRLVYQGTLSTNGGHYDLREIFRAIAAEGLSLDVYPARPVAEYRALAEVTPGLTCHDMLAPARLLEVLPGYDFGWAGFNGTRNRAHLDTALPNKAFEYLGCGLPVLTFEHRALSRLIDDHGVGLTLATVDGLADRVAALGVGALRRRAAAVRGTLTVEANIHRIAALYEELVER